MLEALVAYKVLNSKKDKSNDEKSNECGEEVFIDIISILTLMLVLILMGSALYTAKQVKESSRTAALM